jgi:membrane protein required for beta-lactamase induction
MSASMVDLSSLQGVWNGILLLVLGVMVIWRCVVAGDSGLRLHHVNEDQADF